MLYGRAVSTQAVPLQPPPGKMLLHVRISHKMCELQLPKEKSSPGLCCRFSCETGGAFSTGLMTLVCLSGLPMLKVATSRALFASCIAEAAVALWPMTISCVVAQQALAMQHLVHQTNDSKHSNNDNNNSNKNSMNSWNFIYFDIVIDQILHSIGNGCRDAWCSSGLEPADASWDSSTGAVATARPLEAVRAHR